ncbi:hypothetical protein B0H21DRAFT_684274 [Amylocystis lapponica]|nr:hypothetical protein B0H21DRAFT_684274 [Amylocystis lapponica]
MAEPETYLAVLKASYDYDPQPDADEELAIKENQLLLLLERTDDDWWKVKVKTDTQEEEGASGLVPAAYVEPAEHTSVVKALYEYDATQSTELTVREDELLYVYGQDADWLLVQSQTDDSKVGYVPSNYVEEAEATPSALPISQIVIPPSPPRPVSTYVDPADRVAAAPTKAQADDIQTWAISEVDKKGKKKKGTLGVGNGAVFFASESDKTPVRKWQTSDVQAVRPEKSKHVHIEIGGADPINLHFHAGSKDVAEAIVAKLESSRKLAGPQRTSESNSEPERPISSAQKAVHFDASEPEIIPPREPSEDGAEEPPEETHAYAEAVDVEEGESAVVLYDFTADGEDELSVQEGESLLVLEHDGDEWWKCRNAAGEEGVVPASYVEIVVSGSGASTPRAAAEPREDSGAMARAAAREAKEAEDRAEADRQRRAREQAEQERAERERKKAEAEQRAQAAANAAEERRLQRQQQKDKERAAAAEEARKAKQRDSTSESSTRKKSNGDSSTSSRTSIDKRGPPPDNTRVWHDRTGQFRVEAAFLGFANGKLRLHKVNGVVIEVPAEKMSEDDIRYIEKMTKKNSPPRKSSDDDEPLELRRRSLQPEPTRSNATRAVPPKKGPTIDWFEFFLNAGCDVDDCTRYASSFERDKIDEAILPDITESTMRSLGLREGDIIRVKKAIDQRQPKSSSSNAAKEEQLRRDEELARQLQQEDSRPRGQAPNLFAGPNGALKNGSMRRGRPQPSKSLPPGSVDLQSITTASDQIQRTSSPKVISPDSAPSPVQPPPRSSSAIPVASGFDDDAWTNRPSSTKPLTPTPPVATSRAPSAPPAPAPPPAPPVVAPVQAAPPAPTPPPAPATTGSTLAKTDNDIFDQLARLSQLRTQSPAVAPSSSGPSPIRAPSVPIVSPPPTGYQSGMGMGPSPVPIGQHLQNQQTGFLPPPQPMNGPRGPFAPVPGNQSLLQPLVPTTTGFNSFVPTRPQSSASPFQSSPFQTPPQQPSFLSVQPTGFSAPSPSLQPQMTGYPSPSPIMSQPTGMPNGNFGQPGSGFGPPPSFQNSGFGQIQSNPTGFNPGFGQMAYNNGVNSQPPLAPPSQPAAPNTTPANIFAQMKSGTFANDSAPQGADKYDALRPNPSPLTAQPTGWFQGMNGFQGGYGYQR